MSEIIETFTNKVRMIGASNPNKYLQSCLELLSEVQNECHRCGMYDIDNKIRSICHELLSATIYDVDGFRTRLLLEAEYLDQLILAHQQDWESPANSIKN
jgi:hypothetical protein